MISVFAAALSLGALGCSGNRGTSSTREATAARTSSSSTRPMSLTGCLQQGAHGTYILTALNKPKQPDSSNPAVVGEEKLAAAEHAYRLRSTGHDNLAELLGKRIHIEGTLTDRSDLMASDKSGSSVATTGLTADAKAIESGRENVNVDDLAEVNVTTAQEVANACGGSH